MKLSLTQLKNLIKEEIDNASTDSDARDFARELREWSGVEVDEADAADIIWAISASNVAYNIINRARQSFVRGMTKDSQNGW